jgi:hypothetical protein
MPTKPYPEPLTAAVSLSLSLAATWMSAWTLSRP